MNKSSVAVFAAIILLAGSTAGYMYWQTLQIDSDLDKVVADEPETEVQLKLNEPPSPTPLPTLEESDSFVADTLNTLLGNESLTKIFITRKFIQNLVTTIDNLPSMSLPKNIMPIELAAGSFMTSGAEGMLTINPKNAERYTPYMNVVTAVDSKKLVQAYIRLYPLFQQAYEELGYPDQYFNDRLLRVIDELLAAPDISEPVKIVQPLVVYKFADEDLESRSIGQRIMMRIGSGNEAKLKTKLIEIRQELQHNMHEKTVNLSSTRI